MDIPHDPEELKLLILNTNEPLVFKDLLTPEILKWNLEDWASKLKDDILEFRLGKFEFTTEPQWERKTDVIKSTFQYLLQRSKSDENKWLYFDYKYLDTWFTNVDELRKSITWAPLGFPNVTANDCTIWIGTKGAHTPCHVDTYGFNLIFQVYGKKLWIVAPPEQNLKPTRIPYEESSVYSKLNFFSPDIEDFKGVSNCRKIILNPGEVLYLPHKWWHYVENLETAISINVWIPLPQDDEARLDESIVQFFVKQMVGLSTKATTDRILNPNMESVLDENGKNLLEIIAKCKNICKDKSRNKMLKTECTTSTESNDKINEADILQKYPFVKKVSIMTPTDFNRFLEEQRNRFNITPSGSGTEKNTRETDVLELLSVFTDSDVVSLISEKLLRKSTIL